MSQREPHETSELPPAAPASAVDVMVALDGESDGDKLGAMQDARQRHPQMAQGMAEMREALRTYVETEADHAFAGSGDLWSRVELALQDATHAKPSSRRRERPSVGSRLKAFFISPVGYGAAIACAAASGALFFGLLGGRAAGPGVSQTQSQSTSLVVDSRLPGGSLPALPVVSMAPEVLELDVAHGSGTVFTIEEESGEQTAVIWIQLPEEGDFDSSDESPGKSNVKGAERRPGNGQTKRISGETL